MALHVSDLTCRRGGRLVFRGLSFSVPEGGALIITGPNGAGKTTLLRILAGFIPPVSGSVDFGPNSLRSRSAWQEHVAYSGHLDALKGALSVRQNLDIWSGLFGSDVPVDQALAAFNLGPIADRAAAECSAGQRRRLGLARLVLMDRPLWLLDEPIVSLDEQASAEFVTLVQSHMAKGGIALIATHTALGLKGTTELRMERAAEHGGAQDAFLEGAWA
ncbi:MAG: heme ABC exporter ATP-binding protein CcmA [Pseudomonadota bacterium]